MRVATRGRGKAVGAMTAIKKGNDQSFRIEMTGFSHDLDECFTKARLLYDYEYYRRIGKTTVYAR